MNKLAEFGAKAKAQQQESAANAATQTRELLAKGDLLDVANELRELFDAKLTFARVGDVVIGKEPERGYSDFLTQSDIDKNKRKR